MDILEKNICLHYKDYDIITLSANTFLNILFDELKSEITYFESINELNEYLSSIKKIIELNDDKDYIHLNLEEDKNILSLFAYGLNKKSQDICYFYAI